MGGFPYGNPCAGGARREMGIGPPGRWDWGWGERSPQESGGEPLAGGAGGLREQAEEEGAALGKGRELGHVADAFG